MKQQTAKLILLAAFLFGAVVIIRLLEEPSSSFIGFAAEHGSEHGSDIGCADLQSCCTQGGGFYCAYTDDRVNENDRVDEKCCNRGESCSSLSIGVKLSSCNAADDTACPKKCSGREAYRGIDRCCRIDDVCGNEANHGAAVCTQDISDCKNPCKGEKRILRTDFRGLNICCDADERCSHNTGAAVCVGDPNKGCQIDETRCDSDPRGGTGQSRNLGTMDDNQGYFICCGGNTPVCVPGSATSNGRPNCVRRED